jgi:hypothetical protein
VWRSVAQTGGFSSTSGIPPLTRPVFYTEFDGRRPKRLVIKVLGE